MAIATARVEIRTTRRVEVLDVTTQVRRALGESRVRDGLAVVSVPHTTCAVCVNEDEAGLKDDLARVAAHLLDPLEGAGGFRHDDVDHNARAHLTAVLVGGSVTLPVAGGDLRLGSWQSVLMIEMDGPRSRSLDLTFLGD